MSMYFHFSDDHDDANDEYVDEDETEVMMKLLMILMRMMIPGKLQEQCGKIGIS